jgi:hypothetical protein
VVARSKVVKLPKDVKEWLDALLVANSFGGYEALETALAERGYKVGKSSLQRYGSSFEQRLGTLKAATEQAKAIVAEVGDEEGATNDALVRLVQERLFVALTNDDPEKQLDIGVMPEFAKAIGNLTRASVQQKTWAARVRKEDAAKIAALRSEAIAAQAAGKKGLDPETLAYIEKVIYGF